MSNSCFYYQKTLKIPVKWKFFSFFFINRTANFSFFVFCVKIEKVQDYLDKEVVINTSNFNIFFFKTMIKV
jgi:hypothetical protein